MSTLNKRFNISIWMGKFAGPSGKVVYSNNGFEFKNFVKWQWYFRYRAALFQVANPKMCVTIDQSSYEYVEPIEQDIKVLKNKIAARKRTITKVKNAIKLHNLNVPKTYLFDDIVSPNDKLLARAKYKLKAEQDTLIELEKQLIKLRPQLEAKSVKA